MLVEHWHFQCPECCMGDFELGYFACHHQFFCEICIEEGRGLIRLERWPAEEETPAYACLRPGLVA